MAIVISVNIRAKPRRDKLILKSFEILAKNGGANRKHPFVVIRAMVKVPT